MADDSGQERKPALDAAELKARLGLGAGGAGSEPPQSAAQAAREAAQAAAALGGEIAAARRRAEEALAAAGPAVEDFALVAEERTPLPVAPDTALVLDVPGGRGIGRWLPWIVVVAVAAGAAFLIGRLFGQNAVEREIHDLYINEAKTKLTFFEESKAANGERILDRIEALKVALEETVKAIDAAEAKGGEDALVAAEPQMLALVPKLVAYRDERVFISPDGMLGGAVYNYDVIAEALKFAGATERLYVQAEDALTEMQAYGRLARPMPDTSRVVLATPGTASRKLSSWTLKREGQDAEMTECKADLDCPAGYACKAPACEAAAYPVAVGQFITDVGDPTLVTLTDAAAKTTSQTWEAKVQVAGAADPVQVKTQQILSIDLTPVFADHAAYVRRLRLARLATIVRTLHGESQGILFKPVREKLAEWKDRAPLN